VLSLLVVPLDGSPFGEQALPVAARLAAAHGATLHLVTNAGALVQPLHVGGAPVYDTAFDDERRRELDAYLQRVAERVRAEHGCRVSTALLTGDAPADAIAEEAVRAGAQLVVLTTHGRGGFSRMWLGSVTTELLRHSSLPLLVVRAGDEAPAAAERPAHVLVPLDGSDVAEQVLEHALAVVAPYDARFTLLRVVSMGASMLPYDQTFWTATEQRVLEGERAAAEDYMLALVERLRARGVPAEGVVVLESDPARTILREAEERRADLVAMSTHTRSGAARLFVGSVTDKVLRAATTPVLAVRPPRRDGE
jgi:nucleotide-binding universal stress UspA family protein